MTLQATLRTARRTSCILCFQLMALHLGGDGEDRFRERFSVAGHKKVAGQRRGGLWPGYHVRSVKSLLHLR